ncbi:Srp40 [Trypanosoma melophagium]|uniref:Srp40 n=1 Tax=Trypanosoma melophagium TaxID=715481 RepID=UPI00351A3609|nr:Srp40 [Trypanosoma melophagium]
MKPAAKKAPLPDSSSDDDDDEPVKKPVAKRALDSERSDEEEPLRKNVRAENGVHEQMSLNNGSQEGHGRRNDNRNGNAGLRRFERIDPTKVVFLKEELKDNRPGSEHMVLRQNQEMMRVKGKNFNKLKQKNKAKFYAAGVDTTVRAFQFDDSD